MAAVLLRLEYLEQHPGAHPIPLPALLHHQMAATFNRDELRDLHYRLNIPDPDNNTQDITTLCLDLVLHTQRHGRSQELLNMLKHLRPAVTWQP